MKLAKILLILVSAAALHAFAQEGTGYGPPHAVTGHDPVKANSTAAKAPRPVVARTQARVATKTANAHPR